LYHGFGQRHAVPPVFVRHRVAVRAHAPMPWAIPKVGLIVDATPDAADCTAAIDRVVIVRRVPTRRAPILGALLVQTVLRCWPDRHQRAQELRHDVVRERSEAVLGHGW
jgi:hypothetical protein